ncbi:MAG: hypothetical protein B7Y37_01785 [Sphingobacteriia bacterium 28-36-52]|nr:MAG: hypothetical protein B7Y37_01785 [Sphingobacteriia bacterium 28-36-52]
MSNNKINIKQALPIAIICGILGGLLFIYTKSLPIKGYYSILTYIAVLIGSIVVVRFQNKMELNFLNIVSFGTLVFMIMSYVQMTHLYLIQYPERDFFTMDSFLRFWMIFAVAVLSSVLLALLFRGKRAIN